MNLLRLRTNRALENVNAVNGRAPRTNHFSLGARNECAVVPLRSSTHEGAWLRIRIGGADAGVGWRSIGTVGSVSTGNS